MSRLFFVCVAVAVAISGCGHRGTLRLTDRGGTAQGDQLLADSQDQLYWDGIAELRAGDWAAVVSKRVGTPQAIVAVLMARSDSSPIPVMVVSEVGVQNDTTTHIMPMDALQGLVTGLNVGTLTDVEGALLAKPLLTTTLRAGWYLVLRDTPSAAAGLQGFAKGLVSIDGSGGVVAQLGEAKEGDRLVETWGEPTPRSARIRVGIAENMPEGLVGSLQARLAEFGLEADVERVGFPDAEWGRPFSPSPTVDVLVGAEGENGVLRWVFRTNRAFFEHNTKQLALLEQPLWLSANVDSTVLVNTLCGLVALSNPRELLGAWLLERAVDAGVTVLGDQDAAQWRLAELYGIAGLRHFALATLGLRAVGSPAAVANGQRHRAVLLGADMVEALSNLAQAKAGYSALGFGLGVVVVTLEEADGLRLTEEKVAKFEEALELLLQEGQYQWAGDLYVELALGHLAAVRDGARVEWLKNAEAAYTQSGDTLGMRWTNAVIAAVSDDADDVARRLDEAHANRVGSTPEVEVFVVIAEGNLEALAGRGPQALTTFADALEKAWAVEAYSAALVAQERAVGLLDRLGYTQATLPFGGRKMLELSANTPMGRASDAQQSAWQTWTIALCAHVDMNAPACKGFFQTMVF